MIIQGTLGAYEVYIRKVGARSAELALYKGAKYQNWWMKFLDHHPPAVWQSPGSKARLYREIKNYSIGQMMEWVQDVLDEYEGRQKKYMTMNTGPA